MSAKIVHFSAALLSANSFFLMPALAVQLRGETSTRRGLYEERQRFNIVDQELRGAAAAVEDLGESDSWATSAGSYEVAENESAASDAEEESASRGTRRQREAGEELLEEILIDLMKDQRDPWWVEAHAKAVSDKERRDLERDSESLRATRQRVWEGDVESPPAKKQRVLERDSASSPVCGPLARRCVSERESEQKIERRVVAEERE